MYTDRETMQAVEEAIVARITEHAPQASPTQLLKLAEAYAWIYNPNQPHGGATEPQAAG
jgi:hypothetical protein